MKTKSTVGVRLSPEEFERLLHEERILERASVGNPMTRTDIIKLALNELFEKFKPGQIARYLIEKRIQETQEALRSIEDSEGTEGKKPSKKKIPDGVKDFLDKNKPPAEEEPNQKGASKSA